MKTLSMNEIKKMFEEFKGKKLWGISISELGISVEIGRPREDISEKKERGEFSLFTGCPWHILQEEKIVVSSEDEQTTPLAARASKILDGHNITAVSFDEKDRSLVVTDDGKNR